MARQLGGWEREWPARLLENLSHPAGGLGVAAVGCFGVPTLLHPAAKVAEQMTTMAIL
jgi:hypothetical protein